MIEVNLKEISKFIMGQLDPAGQWQFTNILKYIAAVIGILEKLGINKEDFQKLVGEQYDKQTEWEKELYKTHPECFKNIPKEGLPK